MDTELFRNREVAQALAAKIHQKNITPLRLMEVCGTHTVAILKWGLRDLLPPHLELISGPGCPVCVTAPGEVALAIELAFQPGVIFTTFGDMLKVPAEGKCLAQATAEGAEVRVVYSPIQALDVACQQPEQEVVFYGIGFETTAPAVAATLILAKEKGLRNFSLLCAHKLIPPAIHALLKDGEARIDGFLCPGHVSTIIGSHPYRFIPEQYSRPAVISGFEPVDILESILMLAEQHETRTAKVEIQYRRAVRPEGNPYAQRLMAEVFKHCEAEWRGLGFIPDSGLKLQPEWAEFDAIPRFGLEMPRLPEPLGCACGRVLQGVIPPPQCPLFSRRCTPDNPVGPCMVSGEGACAAYYKYGS